MPQKIITSIFKVLIKICLFMMHLENVIQFTYNYTHLMRIVKLKEKTTFNNIVKAVPALAVPTADALMLS